MTAIYVEDHAVDRYIERVLRCPAEEAAAHREAARAYLEAEAPRGARVRTKTVCGNLQVRLSDCVLVLGPCGDGRPGLAVATVLGPDEDPTLAAGGDEDEDDEVARLNRLADMSRGSDGWRRRMKR